MAGIILRDISKTYGSRESDMAAVSSMNLDIHDNQFITLLGPSGCGKTTTLRLIAGYLTPDTGLIEVDGRILSSPGHLVSPEDRGMGMVFQNYAVWPHKTVYENIAFGLKLRKVPAEEMKKRIEEAVALVNLKGLEHRYPNELSGGQQQRVALARSLIVEPDILLLDEPLSNLDAKLRERMRTELKQLQRRTGITFIYVTHDQAEALALSDQIAVIHGGQLQQFGSPQEVYGRPANRIVADFMGLVNLVPAKIDHVAGDKATISFFGTRIEIVSPAGGMAGDSAELAIRPENVRMATANAGSDLVATVSDRIFLGNLNEYSVRMSTGEVLRVQSHPQEIFAPGEQVALTIDAGHCTAFKKI